MSADRARLRLLIIDDEVDVLDVLGSTAPAYAFDPIVVSSVAQAVRVVTEGHAIDVVVCDMSMPDGGAEAWLRAVATHRPELAAKTIVITGWSGHGESPLAGVDPDRYLYKPFSMSDVRRLADQLLG